VGGNDDAVQVWLAHQPLRANGEPQGLLDVLMMLANYLARLLTSPHPGGVVQGADSSEQATLPEASHLG
jgi:hypothetical protein